MKFLNVNIVKKIKLNGLGEVILNAVVKNTAKKPADIRANISRERKLPSEALPI